MKVLLASIVSAFVIAFFVIPLIISVFKKRDILERPGRRKIHKTKMPSMGGLAIFLATVVALLLWMPWAELKAIKYLLAVSTLMMLTGARDDLIPVKPIYKLVVEMIAGCIVFYLLDIRLVYLYGFLGIHEMPTMLSLAVTLLTIIVITNAFNLIDGLDGLAGSVGAIAATSFGVWFYLNDYYILAALALSLTGAILAFLQYNWFPSKLFMGDTGSLFIGFTLAILAIAFINYNDLLPGDYPYHFRASIFASVSVLIIPLYDTLRVFTIRVFQRRSPFTPDKLHLHHLITRWGLNHAQTTVLLGLVNLAFIVLAIYTRQVGDKTMLPVLFLLLLMLTIAMHLLTKWKLPKKSIQRKRFR